MNGEIVVNNVPVYICDPDKNTICTKESCQMECFRTLHKEFSIDSSEAFQYMNKTYSFMRKSNL